MPFIWYLQAHTRLRVCTGTHCSSIIHALEEPKARRVTCETCGSQFCFSCGVEYHAPADCETIKLWLQKCRDDSGTAKYMAAHTKDCPNCSVLIEKNGGCNHMVRVLKKLTYIIEFSRIAVYYNVFIESCSTTRRRHCVNDAHPLF